MNGFRYCPWLIVEKTFRPDAVGEFIALHPAEPVLVLMPSGGLLTLHSAILLSAMPKANRDRANEFRKQTGFAEMTLCSQRHAERLDVRGSELIHNWHNLLKAIDPSAPTQPVTSSEHWVLAGVLAGHHTISAIPVLLSVSANFAFRDLLDAFTFAEKLGINHVWSNFLLYVRQN